MPVPGSPVTARYALLAVLLFLSVLHGPLLLSGAINSRDHVDHYLRVQQYASELTAGRWPQLLPDPVRGGGHAFARYYPPLAHLAAVPLYLATGNAVLATHITAVACLLFAAWAMFAMLRAVGATPAAAALGALAYGTVPYQFTLLWVRGAFAEAMTLLWYPLLLLGAWRLVNIGRLPRWWPAVLAASLLTHTATALWAIPALGLLGLLTFGTPVSRRVGASILIAGLLALGLAACYLIPMRAGLANVRAGDPDLLWAGVDHFKRTADRLPAGPVLALLVAGMGIGGGIAWWRLRTTPLHAARLLAATLLVLSGVVGFIVAPGGLWALVPGPFRYIQFPWRLMGIAMLLVSVALGLVAARFTSVAGRRVVLACIALLAIAAVPRTVLISREAPTLSRERIERLVHTSYADLGLTYHGDYLPRGAEPVTLARNIARSRFSLLNASGPAGWQRNRDGATALVRLDEAAVVRLPLTGYADLWTVRNTETGAKVPATAVDGQLAVSLDPGRHHLGISPRLPWSTLVGLVLSLGTVIVLFSAPGTWFTSPRT